MRKFLVSLAALNLLVAVGIGAWSVWTAGMGALHAVDEFAVLDMHGAINWENVRTIEGLEKAGPRSDEVPLRIVRRTNDRVLILSVASIGALACNATILFVASFRSLKGTTRTEHEHEGSQSNNRA